MKIVAFDGKHKIADQWEDDAYTVIQQPSANIPVYVVQKENGTGPKWTLLLPINFLPVDKSKVAPSIQPRRNNKTSVEDKPHVTPHQDPNEDELSDDNDNDLLLIHHHNDNPDNVHVTETDDSDNALMMRQIPTMMVVLILLLSIQLQAPTQVMRLLK